MFCACSIPNRFKKVLKEDNVNVGVSWSEIKAICVYWVYQIQLLCQKFVKWAKIKPSLLHASIFSSFFKLLYKSLERQILHHNNKRFMMLENKKKELINIKIKKKFVYVK